MTPNAQAALTAKRAMTPTDWASLTDAEKAEFTDANSDGVNNVQDLLNVNKQWGTVPPADTTTPIPPGSGRTWNWTGATGTPHTVNVAAPTGTVTTILDGTRGYDLSNRSDVNLPAKALGSLPDGSDVFHVGNGQTSQRVTITGVSGTTNHYGCYLGGVNDWLLTGCTITQRSGSTEHALRGTASKMAMVNCTVTNSDGGKRMCWLYDIADFVMDGCTFKGKDFVIGAVEGNFPGSGNTTQTRVLIRNCTIEDTGGFPECISVHSGNDDLVFEECRFVGSGKAFHIDGRRNKAITFRRCKWNGNALKASDGTNDAGAALKVEN